MPSEIKIAVGLGNPGSEHEDDRHNVGYWFVDRIARDDQLSFRDERKFFGSLCRLRTSFSDCWLVKPTTYMNHSGKCVAAVMDYYNLEASSLLVVHDELDLAPGSAKLKSGGGHGGHNGLRDIAAALGTGDFARLRIGIGHPGNRDAVTPYVLSRPNKQGRDSILSAIDACVEVFPDVLDGRFQAAMNSLHRTTGGED